MDFAGTAGVQSFPDELLVRVFSLVLEVEVQTYRDRMLRSVPLWLLLVCKKWHTLLSGPSTLFANFRVDIGGHKDGASNSAMRVLLARLRGTRALKIWCNGHEPRSAHDAMFAKLLCNLDSLPVLESLYIDLHDSDLTSEQQLGMRSIAQLSSLRSLHLENLDYRTLQLLQNYSALSCLTCLHLQLYGDGDDATPEPHTMVLPSFVLQLQRLQSLDLEIHNGDAGCLLPKVDPVAHLLVCFCREIAPDARTSSLQELLALRFLASACTAPPANCLTLQSQAAGTAYAYLIST